MNDSWLIKLACGSEGHLPTHPGKVQISVAGDQLALSRVDTTWSKGVCGDDPSTMQDIKLPKKDQSRSVYGGVSSRLRHQLRICSVRCVDASSWPCHRTDVGCGGVSLWPRHHSGARYGGVGVSLRPRHQSGACCGVLLRPRHQMGACFGGVSLRPRHQMGACVRIRSSRALRVLSREERTMRWPGESGTGSSVSAPV
jgi:hypothetical protein